MFTYCGSYCGRAININVVASHSDIMLKAPSVTVTEAKLNYMPGWLFKDSNTCSSESSKADSTMLDNYYVYTTAKSYLSKF